METSTEEKAKAKRELLEANKFKKVTGYDDFDPDAFYWIKRIKHPFFEKCEVTVDDTDISIWCKEPKRCESTDSHVAVSNCPFTTENFQKVMAWLSEADFFKPTN